MGRDRRAQRSQDPGRRHASRLRRQPSRRPASRRRRQDAADPPRRECDGKPLRGPNDLTLDPKGGFYFTDPADSDAEKPTGTVHYVDPRGKTHQIAKGLAFPNGIVLRPDGKTLLVAESRHNRILAFPVLEPGKVGEMSVFAELPKKQGDQIDNQPDGMCLDADGNLYVAHYGMHQVQVLSPEGKLCAVIPAAP